MSITFAALKNKHYRWLLGGNVAQFFAIAARMMLCNLLAWQITGEEVSLAFVNLFLAVPMFCGALIAGTWVDRYERRRLITRGLVVIVVSELSVVLALLSGNLTFPHLLLVTFIGGCAHPFIHPASIAMMYGLLGRETMANGVALLSSGMNLSRILGPSVTGAVLALFNPTVAYGMVAVLFAFAFMCQWRLPDNFPPTISNKSVGAEIKNGLRYLIQDRRIALCLLFSLPPLMLLMSVMYMLVLFANTVWEVGDPGLGMLLTAMGLGAFFGALTVARFGNSISRSRLMFGGTILSVLLFAGFSQSPNFIVALLLLASANMCAAMALVTNQVIIQLLAKDEARGRVSAYILMSYSLAPLAMFPLSLLSDAIGVDKAVAVAAVIALVFVIAIIASAPILRGIDQQLKLGKTPT